MNAGLLGLKVLAANTPKGTKRLNSFRPQRKGSNVGKSKGKSAAGKSGKGKGGGGGGGYRGGGNGMFGLQAVIRDPGRTAAVVFGTAGGFWGANVAASFVATKFPTGFLAQPFGRIAVKALTGVAGYVGSRFVSKELAWSTLGGAAGSIVFDLARKFVPTLPGLSGLGGDYDMGDVQSQLAAVESELRQLNGQVDTGDIWGTAGEGMGAQVDTADVWGSA